MAPCQDLLICCFYSNVDVSACFYLFVRIILSTLAKVFPTLSESSNSLVGLVRDRSSSVCYFHFPFQYAFMTSVFRESSKVWSYAEGTYLPRWMTFQVFIPLVLLQLLNIFWYYLMLRILARSVLLFLSARPATDHT